MKTLDEVIKDFDAWMPECDTCVFYCDVYSENDCTLYDALHYLKEYKGRLSDLSSAENALKCMAEQQANPALTWDELKQMEGKPVWIEPVKEWMLITEIEKDEGADRVWLLSLDGLDYDMGSHADWQAYRKERE